MKKLNALLALLLALLLPASALAATVTGVTTLPVIDDDYEMLSGGLLVVTDYPEYYLVDDTGAAISPRYLDLDEESEYGLATFVVSEELNATGLLNSATGQVVLPAQYGVVEIHSSRWITGYVLTPTDDTEAPFYDWDGNHYNVVQTDVYYGGQLLLTLPAEEYGSIDAYGDALCIQNDTSYIWLTSTGERKVYDADSYFYDEFNDEYDWELDAYVYTYSPTGIPAFTPGCPLTADQVSEPFMETDKGIIDLQGNVIASADTLPEYVYLDDMADGWIRLSTKDEASDEWIYAGMDYSGKLVIPFGLAALPYLDADSPWFPDGYLPAITTDGCLNFYDAAGTLVSSTALPEGVEYTDVDGFSECASIVVIEDDELIVISATKGQLDVSAYEEVDFDYSGGHKLLAVQQNGLWGCIDMNGDLVVPCVFEYAPEISRDSTRVLGYTYNEDYDDVYTLYTIAH